MQCDQVVLIFNKEKQMATKQRIYAVIREEDLGKTETKLVRATTKAQALAHVARGEFSVGVATQDQIVEAMTAGVSVQDAKEAEDGIPE